MQAIMGRRALSTTIAVLAVMSLSVLLAVGLGYFLTKNISLSLSPSTSCTSLQINPPLLIETVTLDETTNLPKVTIKRALDSTPLSSFSLKTLNSEGTSETWTCSSQCGDCTLVNEGETKTYILGEPATQVIIEVDGCTLGSYTLR